ncbi:class I SAM-dependent methyltransferase [Geomonas anaerohicana]|uniref:Methyltransferase domain-containing protein n=1 Tax=Geomonas anaerohicana TaxID=2798583 RepID=A0ABS0YB44_9BACT|nr:methyltransferase domain-containing protein [Geomonas anaerohicana]MBJ6749505.1 methyltransferase domain-containing protein [Geomonas anaerohicana]
MATAALSVSKYLEFFRKKEVRSVLDYGAGTLRNSAFMAEAGFRVYAADLPVQVARIMKMASARKLAGILDVDELAGGLLDVDLVLSSYVLNIIPDGTAKSRYLKNIVLNLRPDGYLLVEVRCRETSSDCSSSCEHGKRCPNCIKTYSHLELDQLVESQGFRRVSHYYRRHSVAVLYQRFS